MFKLKGARSILQTFFKIQNDKFLFGKVSDFSNDMNWVKNKHC